MSILFAGFGPKTIVWTRWTVLQQEICSAETKPYTTQRWGSEAVSRRSGEGKYSSWTGRIHDRRKSITENGEASRRGNNLN